ncbi:MAG: MBL fold metallo-hydrolase [Oscillospiraceae bacterium]|nr:MBL fold metallo-hydrolase [Oscillospiraceae bacterium]
MINIKALALGAYQTNCYLVWDETSDTCVVIDPGYEPETVLNEVNRLGKTIEAVLLTHGHFDHVGGVRTIAAETDCAVYLCDADLSMPPQMTAGSLYYTHIYGEGDFVDAAGLSFKVLHTPGHTPGSVCLMCENVLFSGDTLFWGSCGRTDLPGGSWSTIRISLKRLADLPGDYKVYPGHGDATMLSFERKMNPYMQ